jgi:hypothetical protein
MQSNKQQGDFSLQKMKDEAAMNRELAKGRIGLKGKVIDAKKQAQANKNKANRK